MTPMQTPNSPAALEKESMPKKRPTFAPSVTFCANRFDSSKSESVSSVKSVVKLPAFFP
jgi:hypothetical protein